MKQITLSIGMILLFSNLAFGLVLKSYDVFNLILSSVVIVVTTVLMLLVSYIKMKDGFRIPLYFINAFCGIVEYVIAVIAKHDIGNNWYFAILIIVAALQVILLMSSNAVSKRIV